MKSMILHVFAALLGLSFASGGEMELLIQVSNPLKLERQNETIEVSLAEITKRPAVASGNVRVLDAATGSERVVQRTEKALLFQASFAPLETKAFVIKRGPADPKPESRVDGRYVLPRQDFAWENDRIAFRMYGPALALEVANGIDVWTKRVRYRIVEKWYRGEEDTGAAKVSYHIDHGEGADFFSVGRSLGCGGSGIWRNNRLVQPGVFSSYKTIDNGPIRVTFELYYDKLDVDGTVLKEIRRVSLDAGQNLNRFDVTYVGATKGEELVFVAGLVKRPQTTATRDTGNCWLSLWGPTNDDPVNGELGTGVVLPKTTFAGFMEDEKQYLIAGRTSIGATVTYYAGAGWTRSGDFTTPDDWKRYLDDTAQKLQSPLNITIGASSK